MRTSTGRFSAQTEAALRAAGWREGRAVDTAPLEAFLASAGAPLNPPVLAFLREFHGLEVRASRRWRGAEEWAGNIVYVDPAGIEFNAGNRTCLQEEANEPVCPLAYTTRPIEFYMTATGRVLVDYWDTPTLRVVAESGDAALEVLCGSGVR